MKMLTIILNNTYMVVISNGRAGGQASKVRYEGPKGGS